MILLHFTKITVRICCYENLFFNRTWTQIAAINSFTVTQNLGTRKYPGVFKSNQAGLCLPEFFFLGPNISNLSSLFKTKSVVTEKIKIF